MPEPLALGGAPVLVCAAWQIVILIDLECTAQLLHLIRGRQSLKIAAIHRNDSAGVEAVYASTPDHKKGRLAPGPGRFQRMVEGIERHPKVALCCIGW
jgi:hypothetical protein